MISKKVHEMMGFMVASVSESRPSLYSVYLHRDDRTRVMDSPALVADFTCDEFQERLSSDLFDE